MKAELQREQLVDALSVAVRATSTRGPIQTLGGVLVDVTQDGVELQATDMEISLRARCKVKSVEREGKTVAPGRLLLDVARSLSNPKLTLDCKAGEGELELTSGPASFSIRTLSLDDFPRLPDPGEAERLKVPARAFVDTIGRVARSASRDETRPHLTGVLVSASGRELRMVATDSYRLSVKETELERALGSELEVNVPARALEELSRIVASEEAGEIEVAALDNQVAFAVGGVMLSSRLVEGRFPNHRQLLPESYEHELRMGARELIEVVRRVSLMAQKNAPLQLRFSEGELEVAAQTPDVGRASEKLPAPFKGEPLEIGFNAEFFRDGLESAESEELVLKLISPLRPGLIESGDGGGFLYLVMPIRLNA